MGQDLELLDRIRRRPQHEAGVERVVIGRAVHQEVVGLVAHAVDVEAAGRVAESARRRIARLTAETARRRHHAGNQCAELREIAAVERQIDDLLFVDDNAVGRVAGLDERDFGVDGDRFGELADLELERRARRFGHGDADTIALRCPESLQRRFHGVAAGGKLWNRVETVGAADRAAHGAGRGVGRLNRHAGQHAARRVGDDAVNLSGRLRVNPRRAQNGDDDDGKDKHCAFHRPTSSAFPGPGSRFPFSTSPAV